jgi:hypothetical protein
MSYPFRRNTALVLLLPAWFSTLSVVCLSQTHAAVCSNGFGRFNSKFTTGVAISVGAVKAAEFSGRVCTAAFKWDAQDLAITPEASSVDIDLLGVDLGLASPVVALQIKKSDLDPLVRYEIYSLEKPPRKMRAITGGDYFRAADTDLDGRIEISTAAASSRHGPS